MDSDDLDRWLDEDRSTGPRRADTTGTGTTGARTAGTDRDGRASRVVLAVAGVLGVAGLGVLLLGSGEDAAGGWPTPPPVDASAVAATAEDLLIAPADPVTVQGDGSAATGEDLPPSPPQGIGTTPVADDPVTPARLAASAVAALRARLTVPGEAPSYLEWATPVEWLPLDVGMSVVVLDAIWLDGQDGDLSTARRGRWGVVLGDDGGPLATPWPVAGPPVDTTVEDTPPTGETRLPDISVGMQRAGWQDVTAVAGDPHPLLAGVVVALVEGVPPGGDVRQTAVVWLQDASGQGLTLLGASA